jgi:hypothetical protein
VWGGDLLGVAGMLGNCSSPLRKHPASREISDVQAKRFPLGKRSRRNHQHNNTCIAKSFSASERSPKRTAHSSLYPTRSTVA